MKHSLLVWALLIATPFTGVRIVCTDAPRGESAAIAETRRVDDERICDKICVRKRPEQPRPHGGFNCALTADNCSLQLVATVAVIPAHTPVAFSPEPAPFDQSLRDLYVAPTLTRLIPPPKA